jgi:exodeoxyribonuclease VIII
MTTYGTSNKPKETNIDGRTHVMLDIETLGTSPDSVVHGVGAVRFGYTHEESGTVRFWTGPFFSCTADIDSSLRLGGIVSKATLMWWLQQNQEARNYIADNQKDAPPITEVLRLLSEWFKRLNCPKDTIYVWSNGASFDVVLLEHWYWRCGLKVPWDFRNVRCYRTLRALYPLETEVKFVGTDHTPLDDAKHQTQVVGQILEEYGKVVT